MLWIQTQHKRYQRDQNYPRQGAQIQCTSQKMLVHVSVNDHRPWLCDEEAGSGATVFDGHSEALELHQGDIVPERPPVWRIVCILSRLPVKILCP